MTTELDDGTTYATGSGGGTRIGDRTGFASDDDDDFSQLLAFIETSGGLVRDALDQLAVSGLLDGALLDTIPGAQAAVEARVAQMVSAIRDPEASSFDVDGLRQHGLDNGSPEWAFKYAAFNFSLNRYREAVAASATTSPDAGPPPNRVWKRLGWVLKKVNVIVRSLVAALVPGAGAFGEIKDGTESLVDVVTDEIPE